MLERYEFEVLSYLEREGQGRYSVRQLSDTLCISGTAVMECLKSLKENGFIEEKDEVLDVTSGGLDALEPYRVKHAVILAAGFGSRMMPATADRTPMTTTSTWPPIRAVIAGPLPSKGT